MNGFPLQLSKITRFSSKAIPFGDGRKLSGENRIFSFSIDTQGISTELRN